MSTEAPTRGSLRTRRRGAAFSRSLAIVLAVLVVLGVGGAAVALAQGPRVSGVQFDTLAATQVAGQRLVVTTNQALAALTTDQVSVEPAAEFTLETSGRHVGVQFTYPLDADTEYTVTIDDAVGAAGGPTSTLTHTFRTGTPPLFILQRQSDADDAIFSTNLAGDEAVPIYRNPQIEDFRAARDGIVAQVTDAAGAAELYAMGIDGADPTALTLPGQGTMFGLQVADHDDLVGYTYTDLDITATSGIESTLFIGRLDDPTADPVRIDVGEDARIVQWMFVPQTSFLIALTFDGQLRLVDTSHLDDDPVLLGGALAIDGIEPGTGRAIVEGLESTQTIDLTDLAIETLIATDGADTLGIPGPITPLAGQRTLRAFTEMGADGYPASQSILAVDAGGAVSPVLTLEPTDVILQTCASPSGTYAAILIAPMSVDNAYDTYARPLPQTLETHIIDIATGETVTVLAGSDISWCAFAL